MHCLLLLDLLFETLYKVEENGFENVIFFTNAFLDFDVWIDIYLSFHILFFKIHFNSYPAKMNWSFSTEVK